MAYRPSRMVEAIQKAPDKALLSLWEQSDNINVETASVIRAILLDEIDRRYPEESKAWRDSDNVYNIDSPRFLMDTNK